MKESLAAGGEAPSRGLLMLREVINNKGIEIVVFWGQSRQSMVGTLSVNKHLSCCIG